MCPPSTHSRRLTLTTIRRHRPSRRSSSITRASGQATSRPRAQQEGPQGPQPRSLAAAAAAAPSRQRCLHGGGGTCRQDLRLMAPAPQEREEALAPARPQEQPRRSRGGGGTWAGWAAVPAPRLRRPKARRRASPAPAARSRAGTARRPGLLRRRLCGRATPRPPGPHLPPTSHQRSCGRCHLLAAARAPPAPMG